MLTEYDEVGNYKYPDGFAGPGDHQKWKEGLNSVRSGSRPCCGPGSLGSLNKKQARSTVTRS
jgi:hypothetical protein